jgi:hypothetical protein
MKTSTYLNGSYAMVAVALATSMYANKDELRAFREDNLPV